MPELLGALAGLLLIAGKAPDDDEHPGVRSLIAWAVIIILAFYLIKHGDEVVVGAGKVKDALLFRTPVTGG